MNLDYLFSMIEKNNISYSKVKTNIVLIPKESRGDYAPSHKDVCIL